MVLYLANALPLINLDSVTDVLTVMMCKNFFLIAGEGAMGISCSIGANTLAILLCLGMPWFIKCLVLIINNENTSYIKIMSEGITYNCSALLVSVILLLLVLAIFRFQIGKRLGFTFLIMYIIFITFCVLIELNVFFIVNVCYER